MAVLGKRGVEKVSGFRDQEYHDIALALKSKVIPCFS